MSKVLAATCEDGVVKVGALTVPGALILSEGVAPSSGLLVIEEGIKSYVAKTSPDLKETLTQLITALNDVTSALQAIDGAGYVISVTGATGIPSPPVAAGDISGIEEAISSLEELREALR